VRPPLALPRSRSPAPAPPARARAPASRARASTRFHARHRSHHAVGRRSEGMPKKIHDRFKAQLRQLDTWLDNHCEAEVLPPPEDLPWTYDNPDREAGSYKMLAECLHIRRGLVKQHVPDFTAAQVRRFFGQQGGMAGYNSRTDKASTRQRTVATKRLRDTMNRDSFSWAMDSITNELYEDPMIITKCGHGYPKKVFVRLRRSANDMSACPECRTQFLNVVDPPPGRDTDLRNNFRLKEAIDWVKTLPAATKKELFDL
jgi:hypothetical protein